MYIPNFYREDDTDKLVAFMQQHSFATVVSVQNTEPVATHLPLTITHHEGKIILHGHFAKANAQWQSLDSSNMLAIFTGPHAYISPAYYDKHESVPTWNYLAVHAYGEACIVDSDTNAEALTAVLEKLIAQHEPSYQEQWDSLPERYREGMMRGIVGFEMKVTRLEGAAKLSQNKSSQEQQTIASALLQSDDAAAKATGAKMQCRLEE